jgi:hypothetical protein
MQPQIAVLNHKATPKKIELRSIIDLILNLPPTERITIVKAILQSPDLNIKRFYSDLISEIETAFVLSDKLLTRQIMEARNRKESIPLEVVQERLAQEHGFTWSEVINEDSGI